MVGPEGENQTLNLLYNFKVSQTAILILFQSIWLTIPANIAR